MVGITCKVIRKFSGNYIVRYDEKKITMVVEIDKPQVKETLRRIVKSPAGERIAAAIDAQIETVKSIGEVNPPAKLPAFKPTEKDGIPGINDVFHIVTLTDNIYNGFTLPLDPNAKGLYPVYMIANQDDKLMRIVQDDDYGEAKKEKRPAKLGWYYRSEGKDPEALTTALRDIKRLKEWQTATYKPQDEEPETCKINAKGSINEFETTTGELVKALKKYSKKVYLDVSGFLFQAAAIKEYCKASGNEPAKVNLDQEHGKLIIKNGNAKTTFASGIHGKVTSYKTVNCTL